MFPNCDFTWSHGSENAKRLLTRTSSRSGIPGSSTRRIPETSVRSLMFTRYAYDQSSFHGPEVRSSTKGCSS